MKKNISLFIFLLFFSYFSAPPAMADIEDGLTYSQLVKAGIITNKKIDSNIYKIDSGKKTDTAKDATAEVVNEVKIQNSSSTTGNSGVCIGAGPCGNNRMIMIR